MSITIKTIKRERRADGEQIEITASAEHGQVTATFVAIENVRDGASLDGMEARARQRILTMLRNIVEAEGG